MGMLPGFGQLKQLKNAKIDERELDRIEAIVTSMTLEERRRPQIINGSRRKRIAAGSGTSVQAVNQLIKQFAQMQKMMRSLQQGKMPSMEQLMRGGPLAATSALSFPSPIDERHDLAVRIRLTRVGARNNPIWRVVAADQRSPRDGRFIEVLGHYNPQTEPSTIELDEQKLRGWIEKGAQPTGTVKKLMKAKGISA